MRIPIALILALTFAACASFQPGSGVTPELAQRYGCNFEEVMTEARQRQQQLASGRHYIPQVGWTACELMARVGAPSNVDRQQTRQTRAETWWYEGQLAGSEVHMVNLVLSQDGWVVDYVGW